MWGPTKPRMSQQYMTDPVVLLTSEEIIEGILHYPAGMRLSDALNSRHPQDSPFLVLTRATVRCRATGKELLRTELLLTARNAIKLVIPKLELTAVALPGFELDPGAA